MKTTTTFWTVSALLLFVLACPSKAMPPVPHTFKGNIERIDVPNRELVITNSQNRLALSWNDTTRFNHTCLNPRDEVNAYYRKEAGRAVAREVRAVGVRTGLSCCN
jgi:hypothetical protein